MVEYSGVDRYKAMKAIYMRRSSLQFEITFVAIKRPCRNWSHDYLPKAYNLVDCWCFDTEVHRISSLFAFFDNQFRFGITEVAVMDKLLIYYNFWDVICLSHTDSVLDLGSPYLGTVTGSPFGLCSLVSSLIRQFVNSDHSLRQCGRNYKVLNHRVGKHWPSLKVSLHTVIWCWVTGFGFSRILNMLHYVHIGETFCYLICLQLWDVRLFCLGALMIHQLQMLLVYTIPMMFNMLLLRRFYDFACFMWGLTKP